MCGFAVEVVLARQCNSTKPRLHDRQNAWKTIHVSSYSGGHIRSMRGFAVEVVPACAIVIRLGRACMTARMLTKTIHFSSYSGGHIRSMRGFAVEVVLARHCNSTWPHLHDHQNASKNNAFFILFWRSHSLHARFCC